MKFGEVSAVMLRDQIEPPPKFVGVIFTANDKCGSEFWHGAEPVTTEHNGNGKLQRQNAFANTALT